MSNTNGVLHAGTLAELKDKGHLVVSGSVPIAVFYNDGDVRAIDNRCPHMGFPMHQGTVQDGIANTILNEPGAMCILCNFTGTFAYKWALFKKFS